MWKPGQSGNPKGRGFLPEEVSRAKRLNRIEFQRVLNQFLNFTQAELNAKLAEPKASMLELTVGKIVNLACKQGDTHRLNFVIEQLLGKLKETVEVNHLHHMSTTDLISLAKRKILELEGKPDATITIEASKVSSDVSGGGPQDGAGICNDDMERKDSP